MHVFTSFRCALLGLTLALAGCSKYASVTTQQLTYGATTPAGVRIAEALRHPDKEPLRQIGGYLDAAAIAGQVSIASESGKGTKIKIVFDKRLNED
jgi:hypothetical protein